MYIDAGIYLARTGSLSVEDTVTPLLPRPLAMNLFPSIGLHGQGPYIRLSGGLLMSRLDGSSATPAFFPLLPVWAGILAAIAGPAAAPAVAPLSLGLAVWAVALFSGEAFGVVAAAATALALLSSFPVWWFGRFPMSEPLTMAFVWGGLVFLGRRAPLTAGIMFGLGGLARTETLLFTLGALAWWMAWTPVRGRDGLALAAGFALAGIFAGMAVVVAPSHHFAYLANDFAMARTQVVFRALPAFFDGRAAAGMVLIPAIPLLLGAMASWRGGSLGRNMGRSVIVLGTLVGIAFYFRLGGREEPMRHLGWLASSMSWPGLGVAVAGGTIVWRRGGTAGRLAVILVLLVAVIFVPNPRIAPYQPWAMRRFLPLLLPGLAVGIGAGIAACARGTGAASRALALVLVLVITTLQVPPILAARGHGYYVNSLQAMRRVAELMPPNALVVVDSDFADLQIQVPLWLVYGRETVVVNGDGPLWRDLLTNLVATDRPVYWIQNRLRLPPKGTGLEFSPITGVSEFVLSFPDGPADVPPSVVIRKRVPLGVYGVASGAGVRQF